MAAIELRLGDFTMRKRLVAAGAGVMIVFMSAQAEAQQFGALGAPNAQFESLHQALRLAPTQESAWLLYRSASDIPEQAQARRRAASNLFRTLDSPHRMDLVEAEMQQELVDLQRQSRALKVFYGALTPAQRAIFDARTLPPAGDPQEAQPN
jgi:hypothetical protein